MPSNYEDDAVMRRTAYTALLLRCPWFEDVRMNDTAKVVTAFLQSWRAAQFRHDEEASTIYTWAAAWAEAGQPEMAGRLPYLTEVFAELASPAGSRS